MTQRNGKIPVSDRKAMIQHINQFPLNSRYRKLAVEREAQRYNVSPVAIYYHLRKNQ